MQILIVLSTLVLMAVLLLTMLDRGQQAPRSGGQQRACEQDQKMASLLGINVDRTISITFIMGACARGRSPA